MSYLETKMEDVDFDYIVSKNTLSYLENVCFDYKIRILKDLSENIKVPFSELKAKFLDKPKQVIKYRGKPRDMIDETKCMARIWHPILGPVQCSRNRKIQDNCNSINDSSLVDLENMFCKIHQTKLNYGRIDLPFQHL